MTFMTIREKILTYIKEKGEPVTSKELSEELGLSKNTVYYNTTILVTAEKIERYKGLAGLFVLVEPRVKIEDADEYKEA